VDEFKRKDSQLELQLIRGYPIGHPFRPEISQEVCGLYGVRYSVDGTGQPDATYYPYRTDGKVSDAKKKTKDKRFYCITGKINSAELFGQHTIPDNRKGMLIITEGEDDALAAKTMLLAMGKDWSVVSTQNGANAETEKGKGATVDNALERQIEYISKFKKVMLCFDNDKPGNDYAVAVAELIAPTTDTSIIHLPLKDAYCMLQAAQHDEFMRAINESEKYVPESIIEGHNVQLSELLIPNTPGYTLPWPIMQHKTHGLRKGEITLLCAGTGIGKTTIARELGVHCINQHDLTIGNIYLEEQWKKTAQGFVAIDNNVPLPMLRMNPKMLSKEQWQASHAKFFGSDKVHFFKHFGSVQSDKLMAKARYLAIGLKCDFIVLDHITMVLSGEDSHNERKDIDILMTRLAELVVETGVGVIGVVHLKRTNNPVSFNEGAEVSLTDLRGSSQLEALSFNVWAAERDQQSDTQADILTLRNLKNREWGYTGVADKLVYNHTTGRLTPIENEL
jgi:twinkle protein